MPTVIATDGFEANFTGGTGWIGSAWTVSGDAVIRTNVDGPHSGSKHARLRAGTGSLKRSVNLAGRTGARLQVWMKVSSFAGNDLAYVKISVNGGSSYTIIRTLGPAQDDDLYHLYDLDLAACNGVASCQIYFDAAMSGTGDFWYLDDILVTAF